MPSRKQLREDQRLTRPTNGHHWITRVIGVIAVTVLLFCSLAQTTILNERFMTKELINSNLASEVQNDVNASLSGYGIQGNVITVQQTNKLLKQGIHQIYQGKPIQLDTSDVTSSLQNQAGNTLAKYGISSTVISNAPTSTINSQVATVLNHRLNTQDVAELEDGIHIARVIAMIGLAVSIIILVLIAVRSAFARSIVADFRWITIVSGLLSAALLSAIKPENYASDYASFASVITQTGHSILKIGWQMVCVDLVIAGLLLIMGLVFKRFRA